ncbi:MAG: hypothetical protein ACNA71_08600 [Kiritimatiellia bacterium]
MADIEHWQMWYERCALALCPPAAQHDLQGFAFNRYQRYWQKSAPTQQPPSAPEAWHAFESYLALGHSRTAKAWKEWLFARGGEHAALDAIQGGATLIIRDVVRDQLRREYAPRWMSSLQNPVTPGALQDRDSVLSVADLLPDPADPLTDMEQHEHRELATALFARASNQLAPRELIAIIVHHAGKALYQPAVLMAARCSKSSLCNALRQALQKLAGVINQAMPLDSPTSRMQVAAILVEQIGTNMRPMLEKQHPELFKYIKEE